MFYHSKFECLLEYTVKDTVDVLDSLWRQTVHREQTIVELLNLNRIQLGELTAAENWVKCFSHILVYELKVCGFTENLTYVSSHVSNHSDKGVFDGSIYVPSSSSAVTCAPFGLRLVSHQYAIPYPLFF